MSVCVFVFLLVCVCLCFCDCVPVCASIGRYTWKCVCVCACRDGRERVRVERDEADKQVAAIRSQVAASTQEVRLSRASPDHLAVLLVACCFRFCLLACLIDQFVRNFRCCLQLLDSFKQQCTARLDVVRLEAADAASAVRSKTDKLSTIRQQLRAVESELVELRYRESMGRRASMPLSFCAAVIIVVVIF